MATPTGRGLPEKIGHYKIVSELGRGGMGVVYKGYEEKLNRFVAIKVLGDHLAHDEQFLSRFMREARAAAGLSHPNVIPIFYIGDDDGLQYFAMEFVSGRSVQTMIRSEGRIGNPRAAQIILQAAHGLAAAHDAGIIHRDIKPANLMVDERGVVKIADFGVALPAESQTKLTVTGAMMGTPGYLSPEQCMGETVDHRADIYALGVTYYEMLTGRMPFNAESPFALIRQIMQEDPPDVTQLNSEVDADSKRILMRMIARDRDARYQNCHELATDLDEYLAARNVRNITASLVSKSTASSDAQSTPTLLVDSPHATIAQPSAPVAQTSVNLAPPLAVTDPGTPQFAQPATIPPASAPVAQQKSSSSFALIAAIAVIAFLAAVAGAGLIGYKMWRGHSFFSTNAQKASVLPITPTTTETKAVAPSNVESNVELSNPVPSALDTASSSVGQTPSPVQTSTGVKSSALVSPTTAPTPTHARTGEAPVLHRTTQTNTRVAQVDRTTPMTRVETPAPPRRDNVAIAVQGESSLNGAVAEVLTSELSSAGLDVANADDLPATEGMARSASSGALLDRLRGNAGILVVARIEPAGERELKYMGRYDTAYSSRINITVYDVASGRPIGTRASATIEYTSINASKKAEEVVGPLAQKAVEAIQNR